MTIPESIANPLGESSQRILVIDDEAVVGMSCQRILAQDGHQVDTRQNPQEGLQAAASGDYDIILLDLMMPEIPGMDVLGQLRSAGVTAEVVIITGVSEVQTAVEAMKLGAADYLSKPFTPDELRLVVRKVIERSALIRENASLRRQVEAQQGFAGMIGGSRAMERVFALIRRVAPTDGTVLIAGESGTGKEMVAQAVHTLSRRKDRPFVACDCSSLAVGLLESELFGHVRGVFTGAVATKPGLFEAAHKGTLFLDEVANISMETQGKLLRVLETRQVKRVGDASEHEVDIRLIAASNRDLMTMVREGTFREDLFYRLNVVPIETPPLRERSGDIPRLAMAFLERFTRSSGLAVRGFAPEAMATMEGYRWPGNVRELRNIVERMVILCDAERIEIRHLPPEMRETHNPISTLTLPTRWEEFKRFKTDVKAKAVDDLERQFLMNALQQAEGNVSKAADAVGMQRTNFHALLRRHHLTTDD